MEEFYASEESAGLEVAIIGMAGRFPGASTIDEFWQNLRNGVESISFFTDEELLESGIDEKVFNRPNYVRARGIIKDADKFDASFFNFFPKEAEMLDPQHRIFMECAWEALESAGYYSENFEGLISLFAGVGMNTYIIPYLAATQGKIDTAEGYQVSIGNEKDFLTTKISYKLNLRGISMDVQTACSTSLTATYLAYQSLVNYQSDMALAGGCTITFPQKSGFTYQEGMILSPDGHCRAFDAEANGTIAGNGCGVVLLKRLEDALADNDHIFAVIKGGASNNDGSLKVGYTAPSVDGQAQVIAEAQFVAGVEADDISYIETHGTGTNLGDPIEITALTKAFRGKTKRTQYCAIGSVKPNIGHLDAAAGVASLIKTALALKYKEIPPSINFKNPNPKIDFENSPFYVNTELAKWESKDKPLLAGVSSFGIGGTNVHLVLEEPPHRVSTTQSRRHQLVLLSARSQDALSRVRENLVTHLQNNPHIDLADVAFTLQLGRKGFNHRMAVVCRSREDAIETLADVDPQRIKVQSHNDDVEEKSIVFMFSGQGAQYVNMGRDLYENEPTFRESVDECCDILHPLLGLDLRDVLYPADENVGAAQEQLTQTKITQPALFVIEYALSELWKQWGVEPQGMIGHSIGEYTAACLAGVMRLEDALKLVSLRGELMQRMPGGAMVSVPLGREDAQKYVNDDISLAALNAEDLSVLSGPFEAMDALEKQLQKDNVECTRLHTSHAFHSKMMEPILETFEQEAAKIQLHEPQIPYISNVTGTWITASEATDPNYYARHLRSAVNFSQGIDEMLSEYDYIYLEVGPGKTLSTLARRHSSAAGRVILSSLRHPKETIDDQAFVLNSLGQIWLAGGHVNWEGFDTHEVRHRVPLPTYPFERQRYWLDVDAPVVATKTKSGEKRTDVSKWFYAPSWRRAIKSPQFDGAGNNIIYLVFSNAESSRLKDVIEANGQRVIFIKSGSGFQQINDSQYLMRPDAEEDFEKLVASLKENNALPGRILHAWEVDSTDGEKSLKQGMFSLLWLVKKLDAAGFTDDLSIIVCADGAFDVTGAETIIPEHAALAGACKVIPQEYPNIRCRFVDADGNSLVKVLAEFEAPPHEVVVAYRNNYRWLQHFDACNIGPNNSVIKKRGVYMITGGLGDIGLTISTHLAEHFKAKLILVDRLAFPEHKEWDPILEANEDDRLVEKIKRVKEIEKHGDVLVLKADITDEQQMSEIFDWTEKQFGPVDGVIHAAGLVGSQATVPMQATGVEECEKHFAAKVYGSKVLAKLLQKHQPDFVVLQSSLSAVLGGIGMFAYAGVNAFLDAFAAQQQRISKTRWVSANWDGWRFDKERAASRTSMEKFIITPEEGVQAFQLLLQNLCTPQVAISTGDLHERIKKWIALEAVQKEEDRSGKGGKRHPRPNLTTPYVAPGNQLEEELANVWGDLLGIEGIGIHDDFFDLGGHSLLATQLVSRLRDAYHVELPLRDLFESPTIATLSESINRAQKETSDETEKIADVLSMVENLSEEQVQALLKSKDNKSE